MNKLKLGIYKHYKGHNVLVLGIAKHSETIEEFVVYVDLRENDSGNLWVRPLKMFLEKIEKNGKKIDRFKFISEK